jgi:hypothetical protein
MQLVVRFFVADARDTSEFSSDLYSQPPVLFHRNVSVSNMRRGRNDRALVTPAALQDNP